MPELCRSPSDGAAAPAPPVPVCPRSASASPLSPCHNHRLQHRCWERRKGPAGSPDVTPRRRTESSPVSVTSRGDTPGCRAGCAGTAPGHGSAPGRAKHCRCLSLAGAEEEGEEGEGEGERQGAQRLVPRAQPQEAAVAARGTAPAPARRGQQVGPQNPHPVPWGAAPTPLTPPIFLAPFAAPAPRTVPRPPPPPKAARRPPARPSAPPTSRPCPAAPIRPPRCVPKPGMSGASRRAR